MVGGLFIAFILGLNYVLEGYNLQQNYHKLFLYDS